LAVLDERKAEGTVTPPENVVYEQIVMKHTLKNPSSFIVVTLRSTRHKGCVCCGVPLASFDEAVAHWNKELAKSDEPENSRRQSQPSCQ